MVRTQSMQVGAGQRCGMNSCCVPGLVPPPPPLSAAPRFQHPQSSDTRRSTSDVPCACGSKLGVLFAVSSAVGFLCVRRCARRWTTGTTRSSSNGGAVLSPPRPWRKGPVGDGSGCSGGRLLVYGPAVAAARFVSCALSTAGCILCRRRSRREIGGSTADGADSPDPDPGPEPSPSPSPAPRRRHRRPFR